MRSLAFAALYFSVLAAAVWANVNPIGGNGIQSINGDTTINQRFITSAAGTLFNITSNGAGVTTFQLPDAGAGISRGLLTNGTQTISGPKTFTSQINGTASGNLISSANLSDVANRSTAFGNISPMTTTGDLIYATPTAARLAIGSSGQTLRVSGGIPAWSSPGSLTDTNTDGILISGGTSALLGNATISQHAASAAYNGYLTSNDWTRFDAKQGSGNYLTALTGDGTASGPGSSALTLATVNLATGSFGGASTVPNFTVNGKGLITTAGQSAVVAPAGTLSGTTLNSSVITSSLVSVGTIASGTWRGTTMEPTHGGTGLTSYTKGDILYSSAANSLNKLPVGANGQALTVDVTGVPHWTSVGSGSVTSVGLTAPGSTFLTVTNSPITTSGNLNLNFNGTPGAVLGFTSPTTITSSALLGANQVVIGGGAGATPTTLAAGSQYQSLVMGASAPGYGQVNLSQSAAVTGTLQAAQFPTLLNDITNPAASLSTTVSAIQGTTVTGTTGTQRVVFSNTPTLVNPDLGTPSALVGTNISGTAASLTAGHVTTNANLTGPITSVGNATSIASQTGTGNTFAMSASPAFTGTATFSTISAATVSTNVGASIPVVATTSGGNLTAGSTTGTGSTVVLANSPTLVTPALGTPSALVGTNITGTASGLTCGSVTTNANLTGPITSIGNATSVASQTGTGSTFAMSIAPTFTGTSTFATVSAATVTTNVAPSSIVATNSSSQLTAASSTGSGSLVLATGATLTSPILVTPNLGTPTTLVGTNISGTASGLTAGNVTTNANLTGPITSVGNATSIGSQTGTGNTFVMSASPTLTGTAIFATISAATITTNLGASVGVVATNANGQLTAATTSGTGNIVLSASPTLTGTTTMSVLTATSATISTNLTLGSTSANTQTINGTATFPNTISAYTMKVSTVGLGQLVAASSGTLVNADIRGNATYLKAPAFTTITATGACTYVVPSSPAPLYLIVETQGGGGGGGGSTANDGSTGSATTFGSTLVSSAGGGGGVHNGSGGTGGTNTYSLTGSMSVILNVQGGDGGASQNNGSLTINLEGGSGGGACYGGNGAAVQGSGGTIGKSNTGAGGGGGSQGSATTGAGGGAGGCSKIYIPNPVAGTSYSCSVGDGGNGGNAGGQAGAKGGSGAIYVGAYYQ